jgi:hypothetical protein
LESWCQTHAFIRVKFFIITFSIRFIARSSSLNRGIGPNRGWRFFRNCAGISTGPDPRRFDTTNCLSGCLSHARSPRLLDLCQGALCSLGPAYRSRSPLSKPSFLFRIIPLPGKDRASTGLLRAPFLCNLASPLSPGLLRPS